jgi:peptidoglycan/LPS O-acetylase OafA/YrhL
MLVIFHHLGFWVSYWLPQTRPTYSKFAPYTWSGWVGVEIFFVLSGFVITYSAEKAKPASFAVGRLVRLYPAVWICATITGAICLLTHQYVWGRPFLYIWLSTMIISRHGPTIDVSYWTLTVEMTFYFVVFLMLLGGWFRYLGKVMTFLATISSACWLYAALMAHSAITEARFARGLLLYFNRGPFDDLYLMRFAPFFAIGVLIWLCLFRGVTIGRISAILICSVGAVLEIRFHARWILDHSGYQLSIVVPLLIWLFAVAGIVASVKWNHEIVGAIGARGVAITRTLGLMTYPLYLIHNSPGCEFIARMHGHIPDGISTLLAILLSLVAAFMINRYLETPVQRCLKYLLQIFRGREKPAVAPASTLP